MTPEDELQDSGAMDAQSDLDAGTLDVFASDTNVRDAADGTPDVTSLSDGSLTDVLPDVTDAGDAADAPGMGSVDRRALFPEACGFGAAPRDFSGYRVVRVTNLDDSGAGSFREAVMQTGPRIVVFDIGGTIRIDRIILLGRAQSDLYVAGQTAPGGGIMIRAARGQHVIRWRGDASGPVENVLFRYMTFRGDRGVAGSSDILGIQTVENFMLDKVSASWSSDEIAGVTPLSCEYPELGGVFGQRNVTISRSLLAEPLDPHTTTLLAASLKVTSAGIEGCPDPTTYTDGPGSARQTGTRPDQENHNGLTLYRNVFAAGTHRQPSIGSVRSELTENVAYGDSYMSLQFVQRATADVISHMITRAPGTPGVLYSPFGLQTNDFTGGNRWDRSNPQNFISRPGSIFMRDIYVETTPNSGTVLADPWLMSGDYPVFWRDRTGVSSDTRYVTGTGQIVDGNFSCAGDDPRCVLLWRSATPAFVRTAAEQPYICPVDPAGPSNALADEVAAEAGNKERVTCEGTLVSRVQPTDARITADVVDRTATTPAHPIGTWTVRGREITYPQLESIAPSEPVSWDSLEPGTPCADSDNDGLPDAFEALYPRSESRNSDVDGDGYTALEEYLNGTRPE